MLGLGYCTSIIVGCQLQGVSQWSPSPVVNYTFLWEHVLFYVVLVWKCPFFYNTRLIQMGIRLVCFLLRAILSVCLNNNRQSKKLPILYWSLNLHFGVTNFGFEVIILVHRNSKFWQPWTRTLIRSLLKGVITVDIRTQTNPKPTTVHNSMSLQPDLKKANNSHKGPSYTSPGFILASIL